MQSIRLDGWFADFERQNFFFGQMEIDKGRVVEIRETGEKRLTWKDRERVRPLILPGLVDSHVHIESSMLMPSRFAKAAVRFGTIATVSDPHEIANVLGSEGIRLLMEDAAKACIRINFTAPSCVPATSLETSGAVLKAEDLEELFINKSVVALGEMMNYPGVIAGDKEILEKIHLAKKYELPVDGHSPGLSGELLDTYIREGISTDHECASLPEAQEKISKGMKVLIREGSSARNFDQLYPLIDQYPCSVMLCTDDFHPDELMNGHIDRLIRRAVDKGVNFFNLYRAASLNPAKHYQLKTGMLRPGDPADFIIASGADPFLVKATYINGEELFSDGTVRVVVPPVNALNAFRALPVKPSDLEIWGKAGNYRVIRVRDGELITGSETAYLKSNNGVVEADTDRDILKIVVLNRYAAAKPAIGLVSGFGLKTGAIASSIAHDSHNIIAVGTSATGISEAINRIIFHQGGIAVTNSGISHILRLPVAGLMSLDEANRTGPRYAELTELAHSMGSPLKAPFMTLSFMALLVIPHLKIGDKGLFDCDKFVFTDLKAD